MAKKPTPNQQVGRLIGYARVSTIDQNPRMQIDALLEYGVKKEDIHQEHRSARANQRPALETAIESLREGDTLVVWKTDRLARSIRDLYALVDRITEAGAVFVSIIENIDMSTPSGRYMMGQFGLNAEFERDMIVARTKAGMAAARDRGQTFGRPQQMTPERQDKAEELLLAGNPTEEVAAAIGVKPGLIYRYFYIETGDDGHVYVTRKIQAK